MVGDNGASGEGTPNGWFNELRRPQRRRRRRDGRVHGLAHRRLRHARGLQPLRGRLGARDGHAVPVDQAGRLALGRHPQRDDRALAAAASRPRARSARSSTTSSTSPPTVLDAAGLPEPTFVHGVQQMPLHGVSMAYSFDDAAAAERRETQYFEMFVQPRHLPQGLDRGHPPQHALGDDAEPAARRRRVGALRARRLDAGARPRERAAREAGRAAAPVPHRGDEVQRAAARRPPRRALQRRPGRPAAAHPRHPPAAVRRHGAAVGELGGGGQEQVARRDGADRRARWRCRGGDRRPGRRLRGLEPLPQGGPAGLLLQPLRPAALQGPRRDAPSPPGEHQVRMEFAYDGGGPGEGRDGDALPRRRPRSARAASTPPCR